MKDVVTGSNKCQLIKDVSYLRGLFQKFVDWQQCAAIMHREAVYVFQKWMEHWKKCIACQGRYLEKRDRHRTSTKFRLGVIK
jgi:hypothetical protein